MNSEFVNQILRVCNPTIGNSTIYLIFNRMNIYLCIAYLFWIFFYLNFMMHKFQVGWIKFERFSEYFDWKFENHLDKLDF